MGTVYEKRFLIWAGQSPAEAQGVKATGGRGRAETPHPDRRAYGAARRSGGDRVCVVVAAANRCTDPLGAGSRIAAREWASLHAGHDHIRHRSPGLVRHRQPSTGCSLGDGGRRRLCRSGRGHRRNSWRAGSAGFHGDQAPCDAGRNLWRSRIPDPQRGPRHIERRARTLARRGLAVTATSLRQPVPRKSTMGCRSVSCTRSQTRAMGGAI